MRLKQGFAEIPLIFILILDEVVKGLRDNKTIPYWTLKDAQNSIKFGVCKRYDSLQRNLNTQTEHEIYNDRNKDSDT